jgi:hypothetical protein
VICQDFTRFELTARESVASGDLSKLSDDVATLQALARAEAAAIVNTLPTVWTPSAVSVSELATQGHRTTCRSQPRRLHPPASSGSHPPSVQYFS